MSTRELENLISTLQQCLQHARSAGDAFEYFRLWEEVKLAEAALAKTKGQTSELHSVAPSLAMV